MLASLLRLSPCSGRDCLSRLCILAFSIYPINRPKPLKVPSHHYIDQQLLRAALPNTERLQSAELQVNWFYRYAVVPVHVTPGAQLLGCRFEDTSCRGLNVMALTAQPFLEAALPGIKRKASKAVAGTSKPKGLGSGLLILNEPGIHVVYGLYLSGYGVPSRATSVFFPGEQGLRSINADP